MSGDTGNFTKINKRGGYNKSALMNNNSKKRVEKLKVPKWAKLIKFCVNTV